MDWVTGLVWSGLIWAGLFWVCLLTVPCSVLPVCTQRACYFGSSAEKRWQHHGLLKLLTFPQALPVHPGIYTLVLLLSLLLHTHPNACEHALCAHTKQSDVIYTSTHTHTITRMGGGAFPLWASVVRSDVTWWMCADQAECKTWGQVSEAWRWKNPRRLEGWDGVTEQWHDGGVCDTGLRWMKALILMINHFILVCSTMLQPHTL